ncbi:MAG: hypothetical protein LBT89_05655 [Planctomycetaceae bacterium]|jgi:hypothetical protein|nr:hypothetical protein [Planctomycetaceae bacterium]
MTHELILTSVPQGWEPEDTGFCPVAADQSLPPPLAVRLKQLSSYRHISTGSPPERVNPVCYSHVILTGDLSAAVSPVTVHVLSRIGDAGTDYRNKPNILAHHIAVAPHEINPEGPAWTLSLPGFHLTEWESPQAHRVCQRFPVGRPVPKLTVPPSLTHRQQIARERRWCDPQKMMLTGNADYVTSEQYQLFVQKNDEQIALAAPPITPCPGWQALTGDAGWGGVLADTLLTGQRAVVVFRNGQNLLPLFLEALAMLPQTALWRGTFSTYYTGLPDDVLCQWLGCAAESPEAEKLTKDSAALVIDLTKEIGQAPPGTYVEFARQGVDYLLPDKETADTFFQSLIDSETKDYGEGESPNIKPALPPFAVVPSVPPEQTRKKPFSALPGRWFNLRSQGQFYFLYSLMMLLILLLVFLLLDETLNWGIVKRNMRNQEIEAEEEMESSLDSPPTAAGHKAERNVIEPDVKENGKPDEIVTETIKIPESVLDEEIPPPVSPLQPAVPKGEKIPAPSVKELLEKTEFPLPAAWKEYYALQEEKPAVRLKIEKAAAIKIEHNETATIHLDITTGQTYKKIVDGKSEKQQPIVLSLSAEADGKKIRWTDLYKERLQELKDERTKLEEQQSRLKTEIDEAQNKILAGDVQSVNANELEKQKIEQKTNANKLLELDDLLGDLLDGKYEKAHKALLENDALEIRYKLFFGETLVLETE